MMKFFSGLIGANSSQEELQNLIKKGRELTEKIDAFQIDEADLALFAYFFREGKILNNEEENLLHLFGQKSNNRVVDFRESLLHPLHKTIMEIPRQYIQACPDETQHNIELIEERSTQMLHLLHGIENKARKTTFNTLLFGSQEELAPFKQALNEYLDFFTPASLLATPVIPQP